ncbi:hypothetical protein [Accumulibacter sp.]|uniref:hypothetical protein n=1 Tax=Accumulibacter sp. TaxID=2053492 RepID=UPI001AD01878|nr:hypothetical protein [Accumulibacter sp.]MBN8514649.1 hypothetical protein [Accumulibacter sp.]MBO3703268.1 hypothetical protein [Accumulibacter sp.]HRE72845.1 hypothetical protein [Accumulibacter sp.]
MKRRLVTMRYTDYIYSHLAICEASSEIPSSMIFKVYLMRIGGRRRPWRDVLNGVAYVGDLRTVTEKRGDAIYTQALLVSTGALAQSQLPALYEPVLVTIAPMAIQFRGFERMKEPEGFYSVVQEWHCTVP